jgi:uncharacterized protein (DUF433 family)
MTADEIIKDHSHLKPEDISAAEKFAADYLAQEEIVFASGTKL